MYIVSIVITFSTVRQASRIFHSMSLVPPQHSTIYGRTCESFFRCFVILVVTCRLVCPTLMDTHPLHFFSYTTWDFKSLSKDDFRVGSHDLNFRLIKTTCTSNSFFNLLEKFRDHSSGYWFLVQQFFFFSRAWSKASQLDVALKILWTVPESHFSYAEAVHSCKNSVLSQCQLVFDNMGRWY